MKGHLLNWGSSVPFPYLIPRRMAFGQKIGKCFSEETEPESNLQKKTKSEMTDLLPDHL